MRNPAAIVGAVLLTVIGAAALFLKSHDEIPSAAAAKADFHTGFSVIERAR